MKAKRFISFTLGILIIGILCLPSFASNNTTHPPMDFRYQIYQDIVQDYEEKAASGIQPQWTSGSEENNYGSHGLIALMGISIASIKNNNIDSFFSSSRTEWLIEYSVKPDKDEQGLAFDCHFYGPNEKNYHLGSDTAYTRFNSHYNTAVVQYRSGNYMGAVQELGRAIHFISDINNPHHASNLIVGTSHHGDFEDYVEQVRENYAVSPTSVSVSYLSSFSGKSLKTIADESASLARSYIDQANSEKAGSYDYAKAVTAIYPTFGNAQKVTAGVIYKFCDDVGII